jgi:adenylosuccinate synthase
MSTYVVVGLQFGDEGKGKITDVLSAKSDYVVRFQGGDNAGHTVYVGEDKFVLHLLPSGVLQCKGKCIIANGVVVNPKAFLREIGQLEAKLTLTFLHPHPKRLVSVSWIDILDF